jgi:hypothetical protein
LIIPSWGAIKHPQDVNFALVISNRRPADQVGGFAKSGRKSTQIRQFNFFSDYRYQALLTLIIPSWGAIKHPQDVKFALVISNRRPADQVGGFAKSGRKSTQIRQSKKKFSLSVSDIVNLDHTILGSHQTPPGREVCASSGHSSQKGVLRFILQCLDDHGDVLALRTLGATSRTQSPGALSRGFNTGGGTHHRRYHVE